MKRGSDMTIGLATPIYYHMTSIRACVTAKAVCVLNWYDYRVMGVAIMKCS